MDQSKLQEMSARISEKCAQINAILDKRDQYHKSADNWHKYQTAAEVLYEDLSEMTIAFCRETNAFCRETNNVGA